MLTFVIANDRLHLWFSPPLHSGNPYGFEPPFVCLLHVIFLLFNFSSFPDFGLSPRHPSLDTLIIHTASAIKATLVLFELLS